MFRVAILAVLLLPLNAVAQSPSRLDAHGFPLPDGAIARLGDLHFAQPGTLGVHASLFYGIKLKRAWVIKDLWVASVLWPLLVRKLQNVVGHSTDAVHSRQGSRGLGRIVRS